MSPETIGTIALAVLTLLGGAFGTKMLDRWFDRNKVQLEAAGEERKLVFSDNEQARRFLQEQLAASDKELQQLRSNEITLLKQMGELAAKVARQEERSDAQAKEIQALQTAAARWGADYVEMKTERDAYRTAKHDADQVLTSERLGRQLSEREVIALKQEIDQLKGQLAAMAPRRTADGGTIP